METCKATGTEPDKTYKGSFFVHILSALQQQAAAVAAVRNITLTDLVKIAVDTSVAGEQVKKVYINKN